MSDWKRVCVLCARRNPPRHRELETGHVCAACQTGLDVDLAALVDLAVEASTQPDPFASRPQTGRRSGAGSRPPLDVRHLDPHLVSIPLGIHDRADPDDPWSSEALLVLLESWCRAVREDRGLVAYGVATEGRAVTLAEVVRFLRAHLDWMCSEPTFGIEDFADQVRRAASTLRSLDPSHERPVRWTVPCPADRRTA